MEWAWIVAMGAGRNNAAIHLVLNQENSRLEGVRIDASTEPDEMSIS
jgi:hypothetical protein